MAALHRAICVYFRPEITCWSGLDILSLSELIGARSVLPVVLTAAVTRLALLETLHLSVSVIKKFAEAATLWYRDSNPYHNAMHGADVTHGVAAMLALKVVSPLVADLDAYALLLAAAIHDVAHTGQVRLTCLSQHVVSAGFYQCWLLQQRARK
jgi:hypothetical protein